MNTIENDSEAILASVARLRSMIGAISGTLKTPPYCRYGFQSLHPCRRAQGESVPGSLAKGLH